MAVVKLVNGDGAEWLLQVGDEHGNDSDIPPEESITTLTAQEKALQVANGDPNNGLHPANPGMTWEFVEIVALEDQPDNFTAGG